MFTNRPGYPTSRIHTAIATPGWSTGTRITRIRTTGTGIKCKNRIIKGLVVLPRSILTAVLGVALLLLHFVPQAVGQGAGMMGGMGGSMSRHHEFMMGRVPEPYDSMTNPLPDTAEVIARGRAVF
jgi:hypothetical protein